MSACLQARAITKTQHKARPTHLLIKTKPALPDPSQAHASTEVEDFVAISSALLINVGTLTPDWVESMKLAAKAAVRLGKVWVLDPVGCGATPYRSKVGVRHAQAWR